MDLVVRHGIISIVKTDFSSQPAVCSRTSAAEATPDVFVWFSEPDESEGARLLGNSKGVWSKISEAHH